MEKSPLNKLPREIRDKIYELVIDTEWMPPNIMPLLQTCEQIHLEGLKMHCLNHLAMFKCILELNEDIEERRRTGLLPPRSATETVEPAKPRQASYLHMH